jgi:hypothetical protein
MAIRKALVALLLSSVLFCLGLAGSPVARANPPRDDRPTAALVTSSESALGARGADHLSTAGLAALIAAVWIPALVLLTRRRRQHRVGE